MSTLSPAQRRLEQRLKLAAGSDRNQIPPRTNTGACPLSFSQQRLWLLHQSDPASGYYNMARVLRLQGALDVRALELALSEIVQRHAALRTVFESPAGEPIQVVRPPKPVTLNTEPASDEPDCQARIAALTGRAFSLDTELPFRFGLFRVAPDLHYLALAFHHAAVDGVCLRLVLGELGGAYSCLTNGHPLDDPKPPIDYLDFTEWQRALVASDRVEPQYEFWTNYLREVPTLLAIPFDRLRPARSSHLGAVERAVLPTTTVARLRELARSKRVTVFAALLAALEILLARVSGQRDFAIATPVSGRTRPELETLVGCFANTVFLRSSLEGDPAFTTLIERVSRAANDAVAHQDLPFEMVMQRLPQPPPQLQVLFALQVAAEYETEMAGLCCTVDRPPRFTSRCDLTVFAVDRGLDIALDIEYDTSLFDPATIQRYLSHYRALLDAALACPDAPVSRIPLLPADQARTLRQFNQTATGYPHDPVHLLFERQASATPDALAMVDPVRRLTYGQLNAAANRIANFLRLRDVQPGDLVAVRLPRTAYLPAAFLGIWKAGAAWVPVDPGEPGLRVRKLLEDCGAKLLLTDAPADSPLPAITLDDALAHPDDSTPPACGVADDLAYVMYTSGSTGQPKGVEIPHRAIVRLVAGADYTRFGADESFLAAAPVTFDASTFELWGALLNGSKCVLYPGRVPEPRELQNLIRDESITTAWLTSSLFNALLDQDPECLRGLRQLLIGGETLSVAHVRRALAAFPETRIINGYGPTENTTFTCCWPIPRALPERAPSIPVGSPIANTRVYILDEHRERCAIGIPGEIYIGGDGLALGYRNSPQLTAERFITAPWGERLYRSGDLGRWRGDGAIEFLGRTDSQLKIRGFRIEPAEIEAALTEHAGVDAAFVVPLPDATRDSGSEIRLAAYLQPRPGAQLTEVAIRSHLRDRLPAFLLPDWYCFVDDIPRNVNGKRDATRLPRPHSAPYAEARAPHGTTEQRVLELVSALLPQVPLGANTNLFDAGLHSLLASRLRAQIDRAFGHTLQLSALYANPTVEGLAAAIDAGPGQLAPGSPTPFFFAHAGPMFQHLAAHLGGRPFYGIGFSAPGAPPRTIPEHARIEAAAILRIQPQGPYLIGGWSASGVLAVDIARQLTEQGHRVGLVVLFDAPNYAYFRESPRRRRAVRWLRSRYLAVRHHGAVLAQQPPTNWAPYLRARVGSLGRATRQLVAEGQYRRDAAGLAPMDENRLFIAAARHYVPAAYKGHVLLLRRTERASEWGEVWDLGWRGVITGHLEIQAIAGNHMTIFEEPHVEALAKVLREHLEVAARTP